MTRFSKTGAFWLLLVLMTALAIQYMKGQDETSIALSYTEFKAQLGADNILEVTIVESRRIEGQLRTPRIEDDQEY